jgi:hypothetical protein
VTTFYRARLVVDEVSPTEDAQGIRRDRTTTIAEITLTGPTPGKALHQAVSHSQLLADFHTEALTRIGREDRPIRCPACDGYYPREGCQHMWHQPTNGGQSA